MKGQGSTEYLVILAVVLVIALIVIGLLSSFTGFSSKSLEEQSKAYWREATPFSIENIKVSGNIVNMEIKNEVMQKLTLKNISFDGVDIGTGSYIFAPGETKFVNGTIASFTCNVGQPFEFTVVRIIYKKDSLSELTQIGEVPLYGKCS